MAGTLTVVKKKIKIHSLCWKISQLKRRQDHCIESGNTRLYLPVAE
jgi:hypothetical protein